MNKILAKKFDALERQTDKLMNIVAEFSTNQQRFRPNEYEWSMLDVIEHLVTSEDGINKFFEKYKPAASNRKMKISNYLASQATQVFLALPIKIPAPPRLKQPQGKISYEEWKTTWSEQRTIFNEILKNFPEDKLSYSVFKHPRSGPMDMKNVIDFMKNHVAHHIFQLKRIQKHQNFPK